jgi:small subunit ribosomal protein S21
VGLIVDHDGSPGVFFRRAVAFSDVSRAVDKGGFFPVVKLRVRSGESIQEAVRRFRKLCERSGLRKEMRRKAYYEKPSERRRREELKRLRKARQAARV